MSYLCQKCKQIGACDFVSEITRVENYLDFENLALISIRFCVSLAQTELPGFPALKVNDPLDFLSTNFL